MASVLRFDVHEKLTPNDAAIYTDLPCIRGSKKITKQHLDNGSGEFQISRHSDAATAAIIARGNWVKAYLVPLSAVTPIFTFQLENGDFDVINGDEEGGELLTFGGPGNRSYLKNAIVWLANFMGTNPILASRPGSWHWLDDQYGDVWLRLLDEDAARPTPTMPALTKDWSSTLDSAGQPWPSFSGDFFLDIGLNYEDALNLMQDYNDLYVRMSPLFLMQAFKDDYGIDRSSATFAADKVRFVKGVNIKGDTEKNVYGPIRFTHVVVQGAPAEDGTPTFIDVVDPAYVEGQERREGYLQHGETNSVPQLEAAGLKLITTGERNEDAVAWTGTINGSAPLSGKYIPGPAAIGGHFDEGDWVTIHSGTSELDYNNRKVQVMSLTYVELDNGEVDYIIEGDGSITAGSSDASGGLEPGEDPCCGKPGSGIVPPVGTGGAVVVVNAPLAADALPDPDMYGMSVFDGEGFGFADWQGTATGFESTPTVGLGAGIAHEFNESFAVCWPSNNAFRGSGKGYGQVVWDLVGEVDPGALVARVTLAWTKSTNSLRICQTPEGLTGIGDGATVLNTPGLFEVRTLPPGVAMAQADVFAGAAIGMIGGGDSGSVELIVPIRHVEFGDALGIRLLIVPLFEADWAGWTCKGGFDRTGIESFIHLSASAVTLTPTGPGWVVGGVLGVQDGSNDTFTLVGTVEEVEDVYVNGLLQPPTAWEFDDVTGELTTIGWAPIESDSVEVKYRIS